MSEQPTTPALPSDDEFNSASVAFGCPLQTQEKKDAYREQMKRDAEILNEWDGK